MLFHPNYNRPGPGVSKDEPRKKGVARFIELMGRDFSSYWLAGLAAGLCMLPTAVCAILAAATGALIFVLLGGAFGALGGPAMAGLYDTILRTLRDEPGYWWHVYKRAFKRNAKSAVGPGIVNGLFVCLQVYCVWLMLHIPDAPLAVWVCMILSAFLFTALLTLYWAQLALLELPVRDMLRNSVFLLFGCLPRAAGAALFQLAYWVLVALFFPVSFLVFLLTGLWLPAVLALQTLYPALDQAFEIENRLAARRREEEAADKAAAAASPTGQTAGLPESGGSTRR